MDSVRVSAIIPVYNRPVHLAEAVRSLLATDYRDLEILIVDDGSTDETCLRARELEARYPSVVRLINHPDHGNHGPGPTRNLGVRESSGEYVCFLDSDDLVLKNRFRAAVRLLDEDPGIDAVYEPYLLEEAGERRKEVEPETTAGLGPAGLWNTNTVLIRKSTFLRLGGFSEKLRTCEDFVLWAKLRLLGRTVCGGARPVAVYRRHAGNTDVILENSLLARLEIAHWAKRRELDAERMALVREDVWGKTLFVSDRLRADGRPARALKMLLLSVSTHPGFVLRWRLWKNVVRATLELSPSTRSPQLG